MPSNKITRVGSDREQITGGKGDEERVLDLFNLFI